MTLSLPTRLTQPSRPLESRAGEPVRALRLVAVIDADKALPGAVSVRFLGEHLRDGVLHWTVGAGDEGPFATVWEALRQASLRLAAWSSDLDGLDLSKPWVRHGPFSGSAEGLDLFGPCPNEGAPVGPTARLPIEDADPVDAACFAKPPAPVVAVRGPDGRLCAHVRLHDVRLDPLRCDWHPAGIAPGSLLLSLEEIAGPQDIVVERLVGFGFLKPAARGDVRVERRDPSNPHDFNARLCDSDGHVLCAFKMVGIDVARALRQAGSSHQALDFEHAFERAAALAVPCNALRPFPLPEGGLRTRRPLTDDERAAMDFLAHGNGPAHPPVDRSLRDENGEVVGEHVA